jgi:4-hydroxy-3-polyprenylbenzoate decarboxylase
VCLKERRRLVLVPRETPLSDVHLENMLALSRMGATMLPPVPAFYNHPASLADVVDHLVVRVLDQFGISAPAARRWTGLTTGRRDPSDASDGGPQDDD